MNFLKTFLMQIAHYFLPANLDNAPDTRRLRALGLIGVHLFLIIFALIATTVLFILESGIDTLFIPAFFICILLLLGFKKYGNFLFSGNALAAVCALVCNHITLQTGGICARDLSWMVIAPLIAIFFSGIKSGRFWLGIIMLNIVLLFFYNAELYRSLNKTVFSNSPIYAFLSFFFLYLFIFMIIGMVITTQRRYIHTLKNQKAILVEQNELLRQHKELLEQQAAEIALKNDGLIIAEKRLKSINTELENFAYIASHDLKEPLRMVGMYTQLIQRKLTTSADTSTKEYMGFITDGVNRMQILLNDLLQYSRLGVRKETATSVNLNKILELVIHNLTVNMTQNEAEIITSPLPIVHATAVEMTQLFQNLIANAIKFRQKEYNPVIDIRAFEKDNHFLLTFTDNGIGIEQEYHERVFKIFERLHPRTKYEGSGIGLATCKKIVQNHGGDIWLESAEGHGTTFFVTLPKASEN